MWSLAVLCRTPKDRYEVNVEVGFQSQVGREDQTRMWIQSTKLFQGPCPCKDCEVSISVDSLHGIHSQSRKLVFD